MKKTFVMGVVVSIVLLISGCKNKDSWQDVYKNTLTSIHNQQSLNIVTDDADISRLGNKEVFTAGYFITDITGDKIPELIVRFGMCEAEYDCKVFGFDSGNQPVYLGRINGGHCCFYKTEDGDLIRYQAHMGEAFIYKVVYENNIFTEEKLYEESEKMSSSDYTPVEDIIKGAKELEYLEITDLDGIDNYAK
ncbi:MAG: hypothetical protein Q4D29_08600 [Lachnospiraceae bacterium]|nr:hypothetical protein [Lachnospiraceae bacterium]